MNEITIVEVAGEMVVDSRIIAEQLDIQHKSFLKLIRKHQVKLETKFGHLRFEISDVQMPNNATRQEVSHAWLNENQSTALMTLCRNTDRVVDLKFELVGKFQKQKRQLEDPANRALLSELARKIADLNGEPKPLLALPPVPEIPKRNIARKLVDEQARKTGLQHSYLWNQAYYELEYRFGYPIAKSRAKNKLEKIEADGQLDSLIAVMQLLWGNS
jgi:phage regulator Rha-like protein